METHELRIDVAGKTLVCDFATPPQAIGLVLFAHGSGSSRKSPRNRYVADALHARGLATLLCDLLTENEETTDLIDASLRFDIDLLAERVAAITDWLQTTRLVQLPLSYFGASTGAAAALCAAARRPGVVRAVVSRGGRPDLAAAALPSVRAPTLLIVGSLDREVLELNREVIDRLRAPAQLAIVPGASHLFEEPGTLDEVAQLAGEWIIDHIGPHFAKPRPTWGRRFRDRRSAGTQLAHALAHFAGTDSIVFGLPRGGVPVADEIAKRLGLPLDVWLVRKIGMPRQPELGMGAIAEGAALVLDEELVAKASLAGDELRDLVHRKADEIRRRAELYRGAIPPPDLHGKTAIIVDDGIATGSTLRAAIRGIRKRGAAHVVVAAPVAASEAVELLRGDADEVIALSSPHDMIAVGAWYDDFDQVPDTEVVQILEEAQRRPHQTHGQGHAHH